MSDSTNNQKLNKEIRQLRHQEAKKELNILDAMMARIILNPNDDAIEYILDRTTQIRKFIANTK